MVSPSTFGTVMAVKSTVYDEVSETRAKLVIIGNVRLFKAHLLHQLLCCFFCLFTIRYRQGEHQLGHAVV
jgi:hypothetical protein